MTGRTDTSEAERKATACSLKARIFVEEPGRPPRVMQLEPGQELRVGRDDEAEIRLNDLRVSRMHLTLTAEPGGVIVRDLGSSNGTYLGEQRMEGSRRVTTGALIRLGDTRLVVADIGGDASTPQPVLGSPASGEDVVAEDPVTVRLFSLVRRVAASRLPVLLLGETGTGKEVVARALHRYSHAAGGPFIPVNCGALPESIAESELFGHEKGAFTGAHARRAGYFEQADRGTLLLDEVGELSHTNQTRLLRALQERVVTRVGGSAPIGVDVRVVAATNRNLAVEVAQKRFREDLYFRLNGITVEVAPLRARPRDIVPLVSRFLAEHYPGFVLGPGVEAALLTYRWPGNIRELRHAIECAVALAEGREIRLEHLPLTVRDNRGGQADASLWAQVDDLERQSIVRALADHNNNQSHAARSLGISRRALIYKMERFGLKPLPASAR